MEADHSGLFNLVGNVSEWLWDGQDGAANRNFVGGSYQDGPASYSSPRAVAAQGYRRPSIGLRIARGL
jgi:formylglycine-generating enzyme required for sulfatase activity